MIPATVQVIEHLQEKAVFADDGGASFFDIADAIVYGTNNGADILNMSLGGPFSSTIQNAVDFGHAGGVVQVASAGNGNSSSPQYPASLNHVISVGATDSGSDFGGGSGDIDGRASFTQYSGNAVDVVAPGALLVGASVGTVAGGNPGADIWVFSSGTSFSGPLVAGLAALIESRARDLGVNLSNDDIEAIIQSNTVNLPDDPNDSPNAGSGWDGFGRVDFLAAVNAVQGSNTAPVANAGSNQTGLVGDVLTFNGNGSFDPDNDPIVSYSWNFGDGTSGSGAIVNKSYGSAGTFVVTLTVSDGAATDSDVAIATISEPPTGGPLVFMSSKGTNTVSGLGTVRNEDVVSFDPATGNFSLVVDGSDLGLDSATLDALHVEANGDMLMSFSQAFTVPGLTGGPNGNTVDDSDIIRFTPSSTGPNTSGVFTFVFDGSDVGLTTSGEDVDGLTRDSAGNLLISTSSTARVTGVTARDEDMMLFDPSSLGANTSGSYSLRFDGSDVGLSNTGGEDVDALHLDGSALFLSTRGAVSVPGVSGGDEDILRFTGSFGTSTSGSFSLWFDGSALNLPGNWDVSGLCIK